MNKIIKIRGAGRLKTDHKGEPVYKITKNALKEYALLDLDADLSSEPDIDNEPDGPSEAQSEAVPPIIATNSSVFLEDAIDSSAYFMEGGSNA